MPFKCNLQRYNLADFRTLGTAFSTLFRVLLGDFSYNDLVDVNPVMAGLLFYTFIFMGRAAYRIN